MKVPMTPDYPYGYACMGSEILSRSRETKGVPDTKETFQIWCVPLFFFSSLTLSVSRSQTHSLSSFLSFYLSLLRLALSFSFLFLSSLFLFLPLFPSPSPLDKLPPCCSIGPEENPHPDMMEPRWPDKPEDFQPTMTEYYRAMEV